MWPEVRALLLHPRISTTLLFGGPIAAAVGWVVQADLSGWARFGIIVASAIATGLAPLVGQLRKAEQKRVEADLEDVALEAFALVQGYLSPCLKIVSHIAAGGNASADRHLGELRQAVTNAARSVCGPGGASVRAVLFEATGRTMRQVAWSGGHGGTSRTFVKNGADAAGMHAWTTAEQGQARLFDDLAVDAPPAFVPGQRKYSTFMTCGIVDGSGNVRGLLSVDAEEAGSFTSFDTHVLEILAGVLSAGYSAHGH